MQCGVRLQKLLALGWNIYQVQQTIDWFVVGVWQANMPTFSPDSASRAGVVILCSCRVLDTQEWLLIRLVALETTPSDVSAPLADERERTNGRATA